MTQQPQLPANSPTPAAVANRPPTAREIALVVWDFCLTWTPLGCILTGAGLGVLCYLCPVVSDKPIPSIIVFALFIFLGITAALGIFSVLREKSISQLKNEAFQLEKRIDEEKRLKENAEDALAQFQGYYQPLVRDVLRILVEDLNLGQGDRISLFIHDPSAKQFYLQGRFCPQKAFESPSPQRTQDGYPDDQGILGILLTTPSHYEPDIEAGGQPYAEAQNTRYNISKKLAKAFRFPSRCYYGCVVMEKREGSVAAYLILESRLPNRFDPDDLRFNQGAFELIAPLVSILPKRPAYDTTNS